MEEQNIMLTPEEEQELKELEEKGSSLSIVKNVLIGSIALIIMFLVYGLLVFYPFTSKMSGKWIDAESGTYQINNSGKQSEFTIKNLSGNPNLSLVFKGDLYSVGSNRYKTKDVQPYLEVNKDGIPNETVDELKNQTEAYKVTKETDSTLLLAYTNDAIKKSFPDNQLETLFYYELTPKYFFGQEAHLKLRNNTFADPTILFSK
ncbi:hypothetical protein DOK76_09640 [Vagococcus sp. DIV0080]|uniref:Uncharacterized protein n=1 Tax=Candidatus Vagococcus giribetii TaxID=2230876 RepID=A0ABS3HVE6_9ENTE|nr:hypothetical protein [Vagococcus sp. DIV0080]MBO0477335.1 hypothetical protein [Vagococcus sp. DIV0080]